MKIILANQGRLYKNHYNFLHLLPSIFQISVIPSPLTALVPGESQRDFPRSGMKFRQKSEVNNCNASPMHVAFSFPSHGLRDLSSQPGIKPMPPGLPWWRSGWESACQCRGHGFEPWAGKIPHAAERLGPWATITEPARLEPVLRNKRGRDSERPAHRDEEWPLLATTRESPRTETKTQHSHK